MEIQLTSAIISFISFQALFCAILIFFIIPTQELGGKRYLVLYFISFALVYFISAYDTKCYCEGTNWTLIKSLFGEIKIIMLYLFIQASLMKTFRVTGWHYLIFSFLILYVVLNILHWMRVEIDVIHNAVTSSYHFILKLCFLLLVFFISFRAIRKYKHTILQTESSCKDYQYDWIQLVLFVTIFYTVFPVLWNTMYFFTSIKYDEQLFYVIFGIISTLYLLSIVVTALLNFRNTRAIDIVPELSEITEHSITIKEPTLTHQVVFDKIMKAIDQEKVYKNSELNIALLAEIVEESPRMISESINLCDKNNFYTFINFFRIKEAQEILQFNDDPKLTISEVMYEVGYNSKSSFYSAFKKQIGQTPSAFRKKYVGK